MGSQPDFFAQQQQQQQASQQLPNFPFFQPIPLVPSYTATEIQSQTNPVTQTPSVPSTTTPGEQTTDVPAQQQAQPVAQQQEAAQPRFPNIIQDEQENRDWLDILYSMSRLMILLCLVYFYSSPFRCLIVIIIGAAIYS